MLPKKTKKNEKALTAESIKDVFLPAIREELLPSMADMFAIQAKRFDKIGEEFKTLKVEIINGIKKIIIDRDTKLETAIKAAKLAAENNRVMEDHGKRIGKLESSMEILKQAVKSSTA